MAQIWSRVRDKTTGHHFDLPLEAVQLLVRRGAVEEVTDGPSGGRHRGKPRPPKHRVPLGTPARKTAKAVAEPKESESP